MKKLLCILTCFIFFIPCVLSQNYPLVTPRIDSDITNTPEPVIEEQFALRLRWEGVQQIRTGERSIFTLRANSWNAQRPPSTFFMPTVPQGIILSSQTVTAAERENGILMKLMIIPLTTGNITLPTRVLQYEGIRFEIPALNIRVN